MISPQAICGPRGLDPGREADIGERTLSSYRAASALFLAFLDREGFNPVWGEEWDDLVVEWAVADAVPSSKLRMTIAALEFLFPRLRGKMLWSRRRLDTQSHLTPIVHTRPAGMDVCVLIGAQMAASGRARMGLGMQLQCALGLRPGELIQLTPADVDISPEENKRHVAIFRLGRKTGTKAGREQFALLNLYEHELLWKSILILIVATPPHERLFPHSLASYASWLKQAQAQLRLELQLSPHSPRVGFASDAIVAGIPAPQIKEAGRWLSDSSFRIYVDAVGSLRVAQAVVLAGRAPAIAWLKWHRDEYYNEETLKCYDFASSEGQAQGLNTQRLRRGRGRGSGRAGASSGRGRGGSAGSR